MENHSPAKKIFAFVGIIAAALIILSVSLGAFEDEQEIMQPEPTDQNMIVPEDYAPTSSTSVESDMDSYLDYSNDVPSSADFNDSYSDLNQ